jgi:hypothetical protein
MRDEGQYILRSIAESIMNLSLGLRTKMTPQKRVLQVAGVVQLRPLAMNEYVGWGTISDPTSRSYPAVKIIPCRFPTYYPPLRLGGPPISKARSMARREEAAAHGVDIARYRDRVSCMGKSSEISLRFGRFAFRKSKSGRRRVWLADYPTGRNPNLMIALSSSRGGSYEFVEFTGGPNKVCLI